MDFIVTLGGSEYARFDTEEEAVACYDGLKKHYGHFEIELIAFDPADIKREIAAL